MGVLQRDTMRDQLAIELAFTIATEIDADELDNAVLRATDELSRFIPLQLVAELHFNLAVSAEAFTASTSLSVISLANKPIRPLSEKVTLVSDGTEYVRNTDYEMDYINGAIVTLGGDIADGASLSVTYDRDQTLFDISSELTRPIAITRVIYTVQNIPADDVRFDWHGDFLEIMTSSRGGSQGSVGDDQNIRIFYLAYHTPPTDAAGGSYPAYLDEVVQLGMGGFALRSAAMKERWLANAAIVSAKTETALGNAALDAADAALLVMRGSAGEPYNDAISTLVLAKTALDKVAVELTTDMNDILDVAVVNIGVVRGSGTEPYDAAIAQLLTMITELTEADTASDSINALITAATNSIQEGLELLPALITAMNADIDNVEDALETDTKNANAYLATGDAFLNTVNTGGPNVPIEYLEYGRTKVSIAQTWIAGAGMRARNIESKLGEIQGRISFVEKVVDEVTAKLGVVNGYNQVVAAYNNTANILIGETQARLNIANGRRALADGFIAEASQRIAQAQGYIAVATLAIQEAQSNIAIAAQRHATAASYLLAADTDQAAADKLIEEADRRIGEFRGTIRDRQQVATSGGALASRNQYA